MYNGLTKGLSKGKDMDCLISVIVPVYKVEQYIHRCVDSILAQTFTDFELILVDDGSPDNCGKICDEYALKDNRIHVIHKENGGLSDARNAGIDWAFAHSDSEWLTFIDSDDWVHPDYLNFLYRAVVENEESLSVCPYKRIKSFIPFGIETYSAIQANTQDIFVDKRVNMIVACGKLYKKSDFTFIRFPVGRLHEDEFTTYKLLFKHEKIVFVDVELYYYYVNEESITQSAWSIKRLDSLDAFRVQMQFFKKNGYKMAYENSARVLYLGYAAAVHMLREHYGSALFLRFKYLTLYCLCKLRYFDRFLTLNDKIIVKKEIHPVIFKLKKWIRKKKSNFHEIVKGRKLF